MSFSALPGGISDGAPDLPTAQPIPSSPRSTIARTLVERGYIHQVTDLAGVDHDFATGIMPVYAGFDATAGSLHVGHLVPIMAPRRLQQAGHKPIVLIGGGTTRIGDPSFRSAARPMRVKR